MPAAVIPITGRSTGAGHSAVWSLLQVALPGREPLPFGILFADATDRLYFRLREDLSCFEELCEQERDIFAAIGDDLQLKGRESGGRALLAAIEDSASNFFQVTDRSAIGYSGPEQRVVDRLFDAYVLGSHEFKTQASEARPAAVLPFRTHLPLYGLRAAATKFGELMDSQQEGWVRAPEKLRLTNKMFVAQVVGRSMEPRIPDGSYCVFRGEVTGSRQGRLVLIERFDENDFSSRFTVKRYAPHAPIDESAERTDKIRLEPLNKEFEAFDLDQDSFRVIAEFIQVLPGSELTIEDVFTGELPS